MKNLTKFAMAVALISGVSATALSVNGASAKGWDNGQRMGPQQGQAFDGPRGMIDLKAIDADKDGTLTKEELSEAMTKKITDNDKDSDGAVSLEEFKTEWMAMTKNRMVRAFQHLDRDGDGKVTLEEFSDPAAARFERMDTNHDGKLDTTDRQARRDKGQRGHGMKGPRGGQFQMGQFGPKGGFQGGPQGNMMRGPHGGQFQMGQFGPQGGFQGGPQGNMMRGPHGGQFQMGQFGPQGGFQGGPQGNMMRGHHGGQFQMGQFGPQGGFQGQPFQGQGRMMQLPPAPTAAPQAPVAPQAPDTASGEATVLPPLAMAR